MKPRIAIAATNGWSLKNFILSGALKRLEAEADCLIWTCLSTEQNKALAEQCGLRTTIWKHVQEARENKPHRLIRQLQKSLFLERHKIDTERVLSKSFRSPRSILQKMLAIPVRWLARSPLGAPLLRLCELGREQFGIKGIYTKDLEEFKPHLVVTGHPVDAGEDPFLYDATALGIPVITSVASWDNLTSKGVISSRFERVLVWNDFMREEVLNYYPLYKSHHVKAIGVARFDVYRAPLPAAFQREPFLKSLGLDPNGRVILFSNSATLRYPEQPEVIEHLCQALDEGAFPEDVQLLIRCHPRDPFGVYRCFEGRDRIKVWYPNVQDQDLNNWLPPVDDLWVLAAMLRHSALNINPQSTITLEAAICGVPIVGLGYDGDQKKAYYDSIVSVFEYNHLQKLFSYGASTVVRSRDEMISTVNLLLRDPSHLASEREKLADEFCLASSGNAVEFLLDALLSEVRKH